LERLWGKGPVVGTSYQVQLVIEKLQISSRYLPSRGLPPNPPMSTISLDFVYTMRCPHLSEGVLILDLLYVTSFHSIFISLVLIKSG
jgi:hypothetical protein